MKTIDSSCHFARSIQEGKVPENLGFAMSNIYEKIPPDIAASD
ncbi:MAG: hypothetical protein AB9891_09185 [Anaerolineaceae bacterium]